MFPAHYSRAEEYNYYAKLKEQSIAIGENTLNPNERWEQKIAEINAWLKSQIRPKDVARVEIEMERSFEEMCIVIRKHTNMNVKEMNVYEFYTLLDLMKNKKL